MIKNPLLHKQTEPKTVSKTLWKNPPVHRDLNAGHEAIRLNHTHRPPKISQNSNSKELKKERLQLRSNERLKISAERKVSFEN